MMNVIVRTAVAVPSHSAWNPAAGAAFAVRLEEADPRCASFFRALILPPQPSGQIVVDLLVEVVGQVVLQQVVRDVGAQLLLRRVRLPKLIVRRFRLSPRVRPCAQVLLNDLHEPDGVHRICIRDRMYGPLWTCSCIDRTCISCR